jgi:hypothetical protein
MMSAQDRIGVSAAVLTGLTGLAVAAVVTVTLGVPGLPVSALTRSSTPQPAPAATRGFTAAQAPAPEVPEPPGEAKIGDPYTFGDGAIVGVGDLTKFQPSPSAIGADPGDGGLVFPVVVYAPSSGQLSLGLTQVSMRAGVAQFQSSQVFDGGMSMDSLEGAVAAGKSATGFYAFAVDPHDYGPVTITVDLGVDYPPVIFTGEVK